jgi:hypothetical protein
MVVGRRVYRPVLPSSLHPVLLHHLQRKISPFADDTHTQVEGLDNDSDVSIVGGDTSGDTVG